jgi:hypothetical protein
MSPHDLLNTIKPATVSETPESAPRSGMDQIRIRGGNALNGRIAIGGAKRCR